jgi:hypothetical protein
VSEWTADWFDGNYFTGIAGPSTGKFKVPRGRVLEQWTGLDSICELRVDGKKPAEFVAAREHCRWWLSNLVEAATVSRVFAAIRGSWR